MFSPEVPHNHHEPGSQYDFFNVLDNVVPNEGIQSFKIETNREFIFDPKERDSFVIYDYISQTTSSVQFDTNGHIVDMYITRMGGEFGEIESAWKNQHRKLAEKILVEYTELLGITKN
jgi:hypothetical protein